jgi:hypothetical protein
VWLLAPVAALVLLAACPPPATALEAGDAAPALAAKDVRGRALAVPASGRVLLLSFASPADGEAVGEIRGRSASSTRSWRSSPSSTSRAFRASRAAS